MEIFVDEINPLTAGGLTINDIFINSTPPSGAGDILVGNGVNTVAWLSSSDIIGIDTNIVNIGSSSAPLDANYALITDNLTSASWKPISTNLRCPVKVATNTFQNLTTDFENGDIINGITLSTGDRVLIRNQTNPVDNGIYVVQASGAPIRSLDLDTGSVAGEVLVFSVADNTAFICVSQSSIVGTDFLFWDIFTHETDNDKAFATTTQAFIDAINMNVSYIKLGVGTFILDNISSIANNNITIEGSGIGLTNLVVSNSIFTYSLILSGNNCVIKDLTIFGNNQRRILHISGTNNLIKNCQLIIVDSIGNELLLISNDNNTITNTEITNNILVQRFASLLIGLITVEDNVKNTMIKNCILNYNGSVNTYLISSNGLSCNIINCVLNSNSESFGIQFLGTNNKNIVNGCQINDCESGGITSENENSVIIKNCNFNNCLNPLINNFCIMTGCNFTNMVDELFLKITETTTDLTSGFIVSNNTFNDNNARIELDFQSASCSGNLTKNFFNNKTLTSTSVNNVQMPFNTVNSNGVRRSIINELNNFSFITYNPSTFASQNLSYALKFTILNYPAYNPSNNRIEFVNTSIIRNTFIGLANNYIILQNIGNRVDVSYDNTSYIQSINYNNILFNGNILILRFDGIRAFLYAIN